jgi:hypothetical protein
LNYDGAFGEGLDRYQAALASGPSADVIVDARDGHGGPCEAGIGALRAAATRHAGLEWNGLAINGQYYDRWLDDFEADGPLPLESTLDRGFEWSASCFFSPRKVAGYARGSKVI